jgi:hypothetical protein
MGNGMGGIDEWLERLSWVALILLPILLAVGGYILLSRLRTVGQDIGDAVQEAHSSRLLEGLHLIDGPGLRDARSAVLNEIRGREQNGDKWWESDDHLRRSAEQLCAAYDYLGGVVNFDESDRVGQFILETWGEDVIRIHDILERFIGVGRKSDAPGYNEFTWLAQEAKLIHQSPEHTEAEHPIRTVIRHLQS